MKFRKESKKLSLRKSTITNLNNNEILNAKGGLKKQSDSCSNCFTFNPMECDTTKICPTMLEDCQTNDPHHCLYSGDCPNIQ